MTKAIFFDKDGTLIPDIPYNVNPDQLQLMPGAAQALRTLQQHEFKVVIVSNQSGIARGLFAESALKSVIAKLHQLLKQAGVSLDGFYFCPHHPRGKVKDFAIECSCRKPKPGLLYQAAGKLKIDLSQSWMVGDILDDIQAGKVAGCRTILLDSGGENQWKVTKHNIPNYICQNFQEVSSVILNSAYRKETAIFSSSPSVKLTERTRAKFPTNT